MYFHASFTSLHGQDIVFNAAVQDNVDDMIQKAAKDFQTANAGAAVNFFKFADAQRDYKLNSGFIDTVNGCEILSSELISVKQIAVAACAVSYGIGSSLHLLHGCTTVACVLSLLQRTT